MRGGGRHKSAAIGPSPPRIGCEMKRSTTIAGGPKPWRACFVRSLYGGALCYAGSGVLVGLLLATRRLCGGPMRPYLGDAVLFSIPLCWVFAAPVACAVVLPTTWDDDDVATRSFRCAVWAFLGSFCVCALPVLATSHPEGKPINFLPLGTGPDIRPAFFCNYCLN